MHQATGCMPHKAVDCIEEKSIITEQPSSNIVPLLSKYGAFSLQTVWSCTYLPHAKVGHRSGNSWDGRDLILGQEALQVSQIPPKVQLLIKKAVRGVCPIQGGSYSEGAPEWSLQQSIITSTCIQDVIFGMVGTGWRCVSYTAELLCRQFGVLAATVNSCSFAHWLHQICKLRKS